MDIKNTKHVNIYLIVSGKGGNMTLKIVPRQVIPAKIIRKHTIIRCIDCPFYEERSNGWDEGQYYCRHPKADLRWEQMNDAGFQAYDIRTGKSEPSSPDYGIWYKCYLEEKKL